MALVSIASGKKTGDRIPGKLTELLADQETRTLFYVLGSRADSPDGGFYMCESNVAMLGLRPGEVLRDDLVIPVYPCQVTIPYVAINGVHDGPEAVVTAGIHGCEYSSIEAVIRLARDISALELFGSLILIPIVDVTAFYARSMYINPLDGKNLFRVFPGSARGTVSERIAYTLINELVASADYYIDLHGGDMIESLMPFTVFSITGNRAVDQQSEALARSFGVDLVCTADISGSTYISAALLGRPAIVSEAGGNGMLEEDAVNVHYYGVKSALNHLGILSEGAQSRRKSDSELRHIRSLRSSERGLFYGDLDIGDYVQEGQRIGEMRDHYGDKISDMLSPASGLVIYVVTSLATNLGDPLIGIAEK